MLRRALIVVGLLSVLLGVAAFASGIVSRSIVFIVWGLVVVASIVFERFRYKPVERTAPEAGWERTAERFVDDDTGKTVTVYDNPQTGERIYVQE